MDKKKKNKPRICRFVGRVMFVMSTNFCSVKNCLERFRHHVVAEGYTFYEKFRSPVQKIVPRASEARDHFFRQTFFPFDRIDKVYRIFLKKPIRLV